ncbi:hypothetical protein Tco_0088368 [Tanacetum coccineum]
MATLVISFSSNSSEESVGTSTARVILFGTIPTTGLATALTTDLPVIHDHTPLLHHYSPIVPTIPPISPTIQFTSPFVCTDSSSIDTHDIPPPPIQDTPPAEITPSTQDEQSIFLEKMSHRSGNFGKILNEPSVETGMTEKTPNTLDGGGMRTRECVFSDYEVGWCDDDISDIEISQPRRR